MTKKTDRRFICSECGDRWEEDDLLTLRACGECQKVFDEKRFGTKCPRCHSQDTQRLTATACPNSECWAETTEVRIEGAEEAEAPHGTDSASQSETKRSRSPLRRLRRGRS